MSVVCLNHISKNFGDHQAVHDLSLDIFRGEFLTLLGPSGCGKTTVLRMIAGLETWDSGQIYIDGKDMANVPACDRDVNTVFQSYALFPHMNVFDNISFGLKLKGLDKSTIEKRVEETLELVRLKGLGKRSIDRLSGGQQQRVAIARAVVNEPLILLLDEPLSALDHKLRKEMRHELRRLHRVLGITFVFVTHDQEEALTMSDRVVVMNNGRIEQEGTPKDIYETPRNLFVADFIGQSNLLKAEVLDTSGTTMKIQVCGLVKTVANRRGFQTGEMVWMLLRPEDMIVNDTDHSCAENHIEGRVEEMVYKGMTVELVIRLITGERIFVQQFFNQDMEEIYYEDKEQVCISWYDGWEVILPHE